MVKISLALVFALVVVVPLHSVLCDEEDQDIWMNIMKQAEDETSKADVAQDALLEAQKVIGDAAAQKAAEDVLGGSWNDWLQKAKEANNDSGLPPTSPDDEEEDNLTEDTELAPKTSPSTARAPTSAPTQAPASSPTQVLASAPTQAPASSPTQVLASAPTQAPAAAPQAQSPSPSPSTF